MQDMDMLHRGLDVVAASCVWEIKSTQTSCIRSKVPAARWFPVSVCMPML